MSERVWNVYLSGEIHSDWREKIATGVEQTGLPVRLDTPVCEHADSDNCGVTILGAEDNSFWRDHKGASMNAIRTRTLLADADIVVVRFGEKYRQWNAAFDATGSSPRASPERSRLHRHPDTTCCQQGSQTKELPSCCTSQSRPHRPRDNRSTSPEPHNRRD